MFNPFRRTESTQADKLPTPSCVLFTGGIGDEPCWCGACGEGAAEDAYYAEQARLYPGVIGRLPSKHSNRLTYWLHGAEINLWAWSIDQMYPDPSFDEIPF
jgi:hypothetical protein